MTPVDLIRWLLSTRNERGEPTSAWFRMAARRIVRNMVAGRDCPILDVAGREGLLFDPRVSPLAPGTSVLDIEDAPLREARRCWGGYGSFVCGDLTRMPFRDCSFQTSVCIGTFYNLPGADTVSAGLREMGRVTRPGGRIICEFRNSRNPLMQFSSAYARKYDSTFGDLPFETYSLETVRHLCADAGLDIVRIVPRMPPWKPLALMFIVEAAPSPVKERRDA
jgi:ubiquinone/menaquinone biosynthesis C-methylase UbiE